MNPIQNPLFKEPVGMTFKSKREQLGLSLEDVSKSLKFGTHLVQAIEAEQWEKLGPAIYANSYLNSYIKLLGLHTEILNEIPRLKGAPALKTITAEKIAPSGSTPKIIFALITIIAVVVLVAYLYSRYQPAVEVIPTDAISISTPLPKDQLAAKNPLTQPQETPQTNQLVTTVAVGTSAVSDISQSNATTANLQLSVNTFQEAWLEIRDAQDAVIIKELIPANQERTQSIQNVGKITLGNASKAQISINGVVLDLAPFVINDVARFTINADGKAVALTQ
ncbi:MAG TPA: RodZ domain-containing protein [Arenimonas sp.]|nr:RodZ domain-containing protein [Arenimonas sp.]